MTLVPRRRLCVRTVFAVAFVLALFLPAGASASRSDAVVSSDLCSVGKSVAKALVQSASVRPSAGTSLAALQRQTKTNLLLVKAAEPALVHAASARMKTHLIAAFGFENALIADLQKANWSLLALVAKAKTLEAQEVKVKPHIVALKAYFDGCK